MKVLIFTHSSYLGGAERSLIELVKELNEDYQINCTVVVPKEGPTIKLLKEVGASIMIAPLKWWCSRANIPTPEKINKLYNESFIWIYDNLELLEQLNPDVILTNTLVIPWGAIIATLLSRPHVWMVNEFGEADHSLIFFTPFKQVIDFIVDFSNFIVTRSDAIRRELFHGLSENKIKTIYRHINILEEQTQDKSNLEYFKIPKANHLILPGVVNESKGQNDAILSTIELVKNRHRQVELIIVGKANPKYSKDLKRFIQVNEMEKYVHILPYNERVLQIVNEADIVLVCSKKEAFGRVVLEGLLMEKPVVATNTGGNPEMISHGETGLLYSPGDYLQLADQIEMLIDNPNLSRSLSKQGKKFAQKTFTRERFSGEFLHILTGLLNNGEQNHQKIPELLIEHHKQSTKSLGTLGKKDYLLSEKVSELKREILNLRTDLESRDKEVLFYASSMSWRFTRPFRKFMKLFRGKEKK